MARDDKRQKIMQAAERLFTSRRVHEITLDDVAQTARVGKGTIYRYFQDKDDLFFQTATNGFDELCELLGRRVPSGASFAEQLLEACTQISGFFDRRRQLLRLMYTEDDRMNWCRGPLRQRWTERRRALMRAMAGIIGKGVAEGQVRNDVPAEVLSTLLLGLLRTRARDLVSVAPEHARLELVVEFFCNGAFSDKPKLATSVCKRGVGLRPHSGKSKR